MASSSPLTSKVMGSPFTTKSLSAVKRMPSSIASKEGMTGIGLSPKTIPFWIRLPIPSSPTTINWAMICSSVLSYSVSQTSPVLKEMSFKLSMSFEGLPSPSLSTKIFLSIRYSRIFPSLRRA